MTTRWLTTRQVAERLGKSRRRVAELASEIRHRRDAPGAPLYFDADDVARWERERTVEPVIAPLPVRRPRPVAGGGPWVGPVTGRVYATGAPMGLSATPDRAAKSEKAARSG